MQTSDVAEKFPVKNAEIQQQVIPHSPSGIEIGLLTGCRDRPYAFGLAMALVSKGVRVDLIGSDGEDSPELHVTPNIHFLNFRGCPRQNDNPATKSSKLMLYYLRLFRFAAQSKPGILHILWNNKFEYFDRTILMLYYKLMRKKIALTAHNVCFSSLVRFERGVVKCTSDCCWTWGESAPGVH